MSKPAREDVINHTEEDRYTPPQEPAVAERLEWFRDQKLAFMVHWGIYSQLGMTESWPLSEGDAHWSRRGYTWEPDGERFRAQYWGMNRTFAPWRFHADEWADFARDAGFRYFILTTKHHDGFCMYDSAYSDYKITAPDCPFHTHTNADVTRALFDAFRARGLSIAPYFSKPDWHCPWYWAQGCEKPIACDRNPTYDPAKRPELWEQFVKFTHAQMMELVTRYGPIDILWLDGGQVRASNGQDIRIEEFARAARRVKPDLLIADRTVGGACENYITPEQSVPEKLLTVPWESCLSIGRGFAYTYDDQFKTPRELARLLITVVGRGGNLALNLGAQPDGRLPANGMRSARALGAWLRANGEAIYGTRACTPNESPSERGDGTSFFFTRKAARSFALLPLPDGGAPLPETLRVPFPGVRGALWLETRQRLDCEREGDALRVTLPGGLRSQPPLALALELLGD